MIETIAEAFAVESIALVTLTDEQRGWLHAALADAMPAGRCVYSASNAEQRLLHVLGAPLKGKYGKSLEVTENVMRSRVHRLLEDERALLRAMVTS